MRTTAATIATTTNRTSQRVRLHPPSPCLCACRSWYATRSPPSVLIGTADGPTRVRGALLRRELASSTFDRAATASCSVFRPASRVDGGIERETGGKQVRDG